MLIGDKESYYEENFKDMETNKQKAIREAYGEYWELFSDEDRLKILKNNGWVSNFNHSLHWEIKKFQEIETSAYGVGTSWRPISLKGIETNNNWISILSESDLPNEDCFIECISNRKNPDIMRLYEVNGIKSLRFVHHFDCERDKQYLIDKAESYKIIPFNPPIY